MARSKNKKLTISLPGKVFAFDLETTGLNPMKHGIHQIAYLYFDEGKLLDKKIIDIAPFPNDLFDSYALTMSGKTEEQLRAQTKAVDFFHGLKSTLNSFVDPFDKTDKIVLMGYNVTFDINFFREFFLKNNDRYFGSYFHTFYVDALALIYYQFAKQNHYFRKFKNYKLETMCYIAGIKINAHDAMSDIIATVELYEELRKAELWHD